MSRNRQATQSTTLILPNAYGNLKYIKSLENAINISTNSPVKKSNYIDKSTELDTATIKGAAQAVQNIIDEISGDTGDQCINIICHCSSVLPIVYGTTGTIDFSNVKNVVIYGLLAQPIDHLERFRKKSKYYGRYFDTTAQLSFIENFNERSIGIIPAHVHVVHANTKINSIRANNEQLRAVSKLPNVVDVFKPTTGYEIQDRPQLPAVDFIVSQYYTKILS